MKWKLMSIIVLGLFTIEFCYAQASNQDPAINSLINQSIAAENHGDLKGAITLHQKILAIQPNNVRSINSIAGLYGRLQQYNDEVVWAQKAITIDPYYELAYINLGNALLALEHTQDAKKAYLIAVTISPNSALAYYSLGLVADEERDFYTAVKLYNKAIELDPKFQDAYMNLAIAYANTQEPTKVLETLNKLIALDPKGKNVADAKNLILHFTPKSQTAKSSTPEK